MTNLSPSAPDPERMIVISTWTNWHQESKATVPLSALFDLTALAGATTWMPSGGPQQVSGLVISGYDPTNPAMAAALGDALHVTFMAGVVSTLCCFLPFRAVVTAGEASVYAAALQAQVGPNVPMGFEILANREANAPTPGAQPIVRGHQLVDATSPPSISGSIVAGVIAAHPPPAWMGADIVAERTAVITSTISEAIAAGVAPDQRVKAALVSFDRPHFDVGPPTDPVRMRAWVEEKSKGAPATGPMKIGAVFARASRTILRRVHGEEVAIALPWSRMNARLDGGLWPGSFTVIVGATGTGKSVMTGEIAAHAALAGRRVRYLTTENDEYDHGARWFAALTASLQWGPLLHGREAGGLERAWESEAVRRLAMADLELQQVRPGSFTSDDILAIGKEAKRPDLLIIDHIGHIGSAQRGRGDDGGNRDRFGEAAQACRTLVRDSGMVVIAVSQTARSNYGQTDLDCERDARGLLVNADKLPPRLSPRRYVALAKESGEIEASATGLWALVRVRDQGEDDNPVGGSRVFIGMAKNTAGRTWWEEMRFDGSRFIEAPEAPPESPTRASAPPKKKTRDVG